jgi:hypothetical protein
MRLTSTRGTKTQAPGHIWEPWEELSCTTSQCGTEKITTVQVKTAHQLGSENVVLAK